MDTPKQIYIIKWTDSQSHGSENYKPNDPKLKPIECITTGFLVKDDDDGITVAGDYFEDGDYRECNTIYRKQINSVKKIKI